MGEMLLDNKATHDMHDKVQIILGILSKSLEIISFILMSLKKKGLISYLFYNPVQKWVPIVIYRRKVFYYFG